MSDSGTDTAYDRQQGTHNGLPDPDEMSREEIDELEAERRRRLDPDNRPENAEVDNTDKEFDFERGELVERSERQKPSDSHGDEAGEHKADPDDESGPTGGGAAGLPDPDEMSQEEVDELEAERRRRLDPDNRPENAEVDNTDKEFDFERGELVESGSDDR